MAAVVIHGARTEVAGIFADLRGKVLKAQTICSFKGDAYEPNIFVDTKRDEFYFTCTIQSGGIANADFNLQSGLYMIVLTKKNAFGEHATNTETAETKNFVGYTNKTFGRTSGYYNELTDRYGIPDESISILFSYKQSQQFVPLLQHYLRNRRPSI